MDDLDRRLLNIIQTGFPVAARPYRVVGEMLGVAEADALARTRRLVESGVIRRIGPSFDTQKLDHSSALVAARVPQDRINEVAQAVSAFPQVTHNYARDFEYNLWFTLICRDADELSRVFAEIEEATGIDDMHLLPAQQTFKIRVSFDL